MKLHLQLRDISLLSASCTATCLERALNGSTERWGYTSVVLALLNPQIKTGPNRERRDSFIFGRSHETSRPEPEERILTGYLSQHIRIRKEMTPAESLDHCCPVIFPTHSGKPTLHIRPGHQPHKP